jgi:Ca2+-binding EF-hand superfamily protein
MKKHMKSLLALTAVFLLVNVACAQQGPSNTDGKEKKGPPKFEDLLFKMDANKDGMLAKTEIKGPLLERFDKIDKDQDGLLTAEEMKAAPKPQGAPPSKNK